MNPLKKIYQITKIKVSSFAKGFYENAETVAVLGLSTVGASVVIGPLASPVVNSATMAPYYSMLVVNPAIIIPILAALLVLSLVEVGNRREQYQISRFSVV